MDVLDSAVGYMGWSGVYRGGGQFGYGSARRSGGVHLFSIMHSCLALETIEHRMSLSCSSDINCLVLPFHVRYPLHLHIILQKLH